MQIVKHLLKKPIGSTRGRAAELDIAISDAHASTEETTLSSYPRSFDSGLLNGAPVAVLSRNIRTFSEFIGWARAQGSDVIILEHGQLKPFLAFRKDLIMVMVDLDDCELEDALDELAEIREIYPELTVVLASCFFGRDDFSLSRLSVGDVSLKLPISMRKLDLSIVLALENNQEWRSRQSGLKSAGGGARAGAFKS